MSYHLQFFSSCFPSWNRTSNSLFAPSLRTVTLICTVQNTQHGWEWTTRKKWLTSYGKHDGRVSLHGQVEACSYVPLNARNRLMAGIFLSHLFFLSR
jgi:hypothetical protein